MFVKYQPEGQEKPQEWEFNPRRVHESQAERIEFRLSKILGEATSFDQFRMMVLQGMASARRVLLWHLLQLDHPKLKLEEVDAMREELTIEASKSELLEAREAVFTIPDEGQRELALAHIDRQIAEAREDGGKAPSPTSSPITGIESDITSTKESETSEA